MARPVRSRLMSPGTRWVGHGVGLAAADKVMHNVLVKWRSGVSGGCAVT